MNIGCLDVMSIWALFSGILMNFILWLLLSSSPARAAGEDHPGLHCCQ